MKINPFIFTAVLVTAILGFAVYPWSPSGIFVAADCGCSDVNGDGWITPIDSLTIVNTINATPTQASRCTGGTSYDIKNDVNKDGCIDEADAQCVNTALISEDSKQTTCGTITQIPFELSCSGSVQQIGSITWTAQPSGGNGTYTYNWNGSESLSGTTASISKVYSNVGTKTATVTVTSGGASKTATCSASVLALPLPLSCIANPNSIRLGESITWAATSEYPVTWNGTDSLTGSGLSVSKTYSTLGSKTATVTVTAGGVQKTATCSATVVAWPPIVAACSAKPSSVLPGQETVWTVIPSGGNGIYTFNWTGTDGLTGTNQSIYKAYSTIGTKSATVTVISGGVSKTATCSATVAWLPIVASCSANPANSARPGEPVTWTAVASGGDNTFTYSWTGTDSLTGSGLSVSKTYLTSGKKTTTVKIASGGSTQNVTCSATVVAWPSVVASCSASPTSIYPDNSITWTATVSGGDGVNYKYFWSGTDKLPGTTASVSKTYSTLGKKTATVQVTSGGVSKTVSCYADVTENALAKIICVGTAVDIREQALGTAMTAYTQSINSAYSARRTALQEAYAKTTMPELKGAVKTAWSAFKSATATAQKAWTTVRGAAYFQYVKTAIACKAPDGTGDGSNVSSEVQGR